MATAKELFLHVLEGFPHDTPARLAIKYIKENKVESIYLLRSLLPNYAPILYLIDQYKTELMRELMEGRIDNILLTIDDFSQDNLNFQDLLRSKIRETINHFKPTAVELLRFFLKEENHH